MHKKTWIFLGIAVLLVLGGTTWFVSRLFNAMDETGVSLFRLRVEHVQTGDDFGKRMLKVSHLMGTDRVGGWRTTSRDVDLGYCFEKPADRKEWGGATTDFSRLATTYFHRLGPVGRVMERFDWFPGASNTYAADARLPASLVASAAPLAMLVNAWSEPPIAVIGLECGTMASYARPFQPFHFYEKFQVVRDFSLAPPGKPPAFTFVPGALERGAGVRVFAGDPRQRLQKPYKSLDEDSGAPDNYYHAIVISAFYTQEIPTNLLTREALQMHFRKLVPNGILCIHVSNRYYDAVKAIVATAESVEVPDPLDPNRTDKLTCRRGHDLAPENDIAAVRYVSPPHYTSEWLMIARDRGILETLTVPADYAANLAAGPHAGRAAAPYWETPVAASRFIWTDARADVQAIRR